MSLFTLAASIVDWDELGKTVVAAVIAGIGITTAFAVAIYGAAQFNERRREGDEIASGAAALIGAVGLAVCGAGIVFGLIVMLSD